MIFKIVAFSMQFGLWPTCKQILRSLKTPSRLKDAENIFFGFVVF